jgi:hypothetical protein
MDRSEFSQSSQNPGSVALPTFVNCEIVNGNGDVILRLRIPMEPGMIVKQVAVEALRRLARMKEIPSNSIRILNVAVNGASLAATDCVANVVNVKAETIQVNLADLLVVNNKVALVAVLPQSHADNSMDLSRHVKPTSTQAPVAAHPPVPQRPSNAPALPPAAVPTGLPPMRREPSLDVSSTPATASTHHHVLKKSDPAAGGQKRLPSALSELEKNATAQGTSKTSVESNNKVNPIKERNLERKAKETSERESVASSTFARPAPGILARGKEADKFFPPDYEANPDDILREKRRAKKLKLEEEKRRAEEEKKTTAAKNAAARGGTAGDRKGSTAKKTIQSKTLEHDVVQIPSEDVSVSRALFNLSSDSGVSPDSTGSANGTNSPVVRPGPKELGWGVDAAQIFGKTYVSDPSKLDDETCAKILALPREKRNRPFASPQEREAERAAQMAAEKR